MKFRIFAIALLALLFAVIGRMICKKRGSEVTEGHFWLTAFSWFTAIYVLAYLVHLPAEVQEVDPRGERLILRQNGCIL